MIEVADRGPGIPDDEREKIFEPFFTGKTQGTGLGLAVARRVVELHGGTIAVARRPRRRRAVPRRDPGGLTWHASWSPTTRPACASSSPTALELDEHTVVAAKDGKEAAKLLDERGFDLVLTDLKMPGLDGMALLRKVRAEQPEVEVIVLTAHGTVDNAVEAMKLGAFEYLQKPISGPDELRLLVARAVERRGLQRSRRRRRAAIDTGSPAAPPLTYGDPAMQPGGRGDREGRAHHGHRAAARRERHRQGGRRARDPRA